MLISTLLRCTPLAQLLEGMSPSQEGNHVTLLFLLLPSLAQRFKHVPHHGEPRQSGAGRAGLWLTAARPQALVLLGRPVWVTGTRPCEALVWQTNAHRQDLIQMARTEKTPSSTAGSTCAEGGMEEVTALRGSMGCGSESPSDSITPETLPRPPAQGSPGHHSQANHCQQQPCFHLFHQMTWKILAF